MNIPQYVPGNGGSSSCVVSPVSPCSSFRSPNRTPQGSPQKTPQGAPQMGYNSNIAPRQHKHPKHQQNCPCCKVKLLSTIHGQPCGSNARPLSPNSPEQMNNSNSLTVNSGDSRPISPAGSVLNNNLSRSASPLTVTNPHRAKNPQTVIQDYETTPDYGNNLHVPSNPATPEKNTDENIMEVDNSIQINHMNNNTPNRTTIHSNPNCRCRPGTTSNTCKSVISPKRRAPPVPIHVTVPGNKAPPVTVPGNKLPNVNKTVDKLNSTNSQILQPPTNIPYECEI